MFSGAKRVLDRLWIVNNNIVHSVDHSAVVTLIVMTTAVAVSFTVAAVVVVVTSARGLLMWLLRF
jgi:hypothetical protein